MVEAWNLLLKGELFDNPAYRFDLVQFTRQVLENAFVLTLPKLQSKYKNGAPASEFLPIGRKLLLIVQSMDTVLMTEKSLRLSEWISKARSWGGGDKELADYFEYNARDQVTLWVAGQSKMLNDYAQKAWGGLVSGYYYPRWSIFVTYLKDTPASEYNQTELRDKLFVFESKWVRETSDSETPAAESQKDLKDVLKDLKKNLGDIFDGN